MNNLDIWGPFAVLMACSIVWRISFYKCSSWLRTNVPSRAPSQVGAALLGALFYAPGAFKSYTAEREARNESTTAATVGWASMAGTILGLVMFFVLLANR